MRSPIFKSLILIIESPFWGVLIGRYGIASGDSILIFRTITIATADAWFHFGTAARTSDRRDWPSISAIFRIIIAPIPHGRTAILDELKQGKGDFSGYHDLYSGIFNAFSR